MMLVPLRLPISIVMLVLLGGDADAQDKVPQENKQPKAGGWIEVKPQPLSIDRDTPISVQQAVQYVLDFQPGWKTHQVDKEPRVILGGRKAYRFSIVRQYRRYGTMTQAYTPPQPTDFVDDVWEFVLIVDDGNEIAADAKNKIDWSDDWRPGETHPINLGRGYGFIWLTNAILKEQHKLRPLLNLAGGDDALGLIVAGMQSERFFTRQDCAFMLPTFGDEALPHLEQMLTIQPPPPKDHPRYTSWLELVVGAIASIRTPQGTQLLLQLYESDDRQLKRLAARGLSRRPFRPEAKAAYLQMLDARTK